MAMKSVQRQISKRQKVGVCALCKQTRKLCESHIVPELAFKSMYDAKHRAVSFSPADFQRTKRFLQQGIREHLLCGTCENEILNERYEKPFKKYWIDKDILKRLEGKALVILDDVDYAPFKLLHLSVLWRASVCKHFAYGQVKLDPSDEEAIRQMLLSGDPGPDTQYPITCSAIIHNGAATNIFVSPVFSHLDGERCYRFTFCACEWIYFIGSPNAPVIRRISLKQNGTLPVLGVRSLQTVFSTVRDSVNAL